MTKPQLYLFIGYPGAGKTTIANFICEATGAVHLWADAERHKLFKRPSHSQAESLELYDRLNRRAADLLAAGRSVVYDTNFNFYADRQKMRTLASRNGDEDGMTAGQFEAITAKLERPGKDEKFIKISGLEFDRQEVVSLLSP